eukprot:evm.model.scf_457.6 EVM.evm.TU.scf_457.6   scf_457:81370-85790(+)
MELEVLAEYVWLGGTGTDIRSKTRVLDGKPEALDAVPAWSFDGSSTGQADETDFEVMLRPQAMFPDPLRGGDHLVVLCDTYHHPQEPNTPLRAHNTNNRSPCEAVMRLAAASEPIFSCFQEYTLINPAANWIINCGVGTVPVEGRPNYCGSGGGIVAGREVCEAHVRACLHAGIPISGASATSTPGQWCYSLGPCAGLSLADSLWVSRHLLLRVAEAFGLAPSFEPEPIPGLRRPLSCHVEFSTLETRSPASGLAAIEAQVGRLRACHVKHLIAYGRGYLQRLAAPGGGHLRQRSQEFSCSFGSKLSSIMIPHDVRISKAGHYLDQRPASNMDPYLVTALLVSSALGIPLPGVPGAMQGGRAEGPRAGGADGREGSGSAIRGEGGGRVGGRRDPEEDDPVQWEESFINELVMHESMIPETPPLQRAWGC